MSGCGGHCPATVRSPAPGVGGDDMAFLIVFLVLLGIAVFGAWLGVDSRPLDPRDNAPQWPFSPRHS